MLRGSREKVDEERAKTLVEESLAALGEEKVECKKIQLSNKSLSEEAARVVAQVRKGDRGGGWVGGWVGSLGLHTFIHA